MHRKCLIISTLLTSILILPINDVNINAETKTYSVKDAISELINAKNYTITIKSEIGPLKITNHMYYTENAFYDDFLGDEYGYVAIDDGVFMFDLYRREFNASKLLLDEDGNLLTSIWNNDLFVGFDRLREKEFNDANGKDFTSNAKRVKLAFMDMFKIDAGNYPNINAVDFRVGDDVNSLSYVFSTTDNLRYECYVSNVNNTKVDIVDDYLSSGGSYHVIDDDYAKIISLFDNFNYKRIIYDADSINENGYYDVIGGFEYYHKDYFYSDFTNEYVAKGNGYSIGVVGIDNVNFGPYEIEGDTYGPYNFNGSYYCWKGEKDENEEEELSILTTFPINSNSSVPEIYNYPTFLKMFKDSQYVEKVAENKYYTYNLECVEDFVSNFQMSDTLDEYGAIASGVYVEYLKDGSVNYPGSEGKETVIFTLEYTYYGYLTEVSFAYTDFNMVKIDCMEKDAVLKNLEDFMKEYIDSKKSKEDN